jgi:hypothetical protein
MLNASATPGGAGQMENAMQILNLTPHDVHVYDADGKTILWTFRRTTSSVVRVATPPQADAGKLETCWLHADEATCSGDFVPEGKARAYDLHEGDGTRHAIIPLVNAPDFAGGTVTGIPEWAHGLDDSGYPYALIVGLVGCEAVARAFKGAVFATDTGPGSVVRDAQGNVLGVRRLILVQRGE